MLRVVLVTLLALVTVASPAFRSDGTSVIESKPSVTALIRHGGPQGVLNVLTYNVAGLPDLISRSNPARNSNMIGKLFNAYDLVLVQEDFWYHEDLAASVNHVFRSLPMTEFGRLVGDGLNRFSAFPMDSVVRHAWTTCSGFLHSAADCLADKGFTFSRLTLGHGLQVGVYNVHADAGRGNADVSARAKQFAQLKNHILGTTVGEAVIVGGDFNLEGFGSGDEPILQDLITATGLTDSCRELDCREERFDRVLFRSGSTVALEPLSWATVREFVDATGGDLSDHKAVNTVFRWMPVPKSTRQGLTRLTDGK
jgi:endonuclease/exonuclease/phosphatase family metal-dependent hydrolase